VLGNKLDAIEAMLRAGLEKEASSDDSPLIPDRRLALIAALAGDDHDSHGEVLEPDAAKDMRSDGGDLSSAVDQTPLERRPPDTAALADWIQRAIPI